MLQIALCDDNIDELSNMVQLIDLYRTSKNLNCEYRVFSNGFELISDIECTESFASACDNLMKYGCFIKPHRSYLVNMRYVDTIENNRVTLQTLSTVPVAQGRAREIKLQYLNYQMEGE